MFNDCIRYHKAQLLVDSVYVSSIVEQVGTPVYIYSKKRILDNYHRVKAAFADLNTHIHYSAKANANLAILSTLIEAGAGIDAVSGGEIYKALQAGADPEHIVFAGVGKTKDEIRYAVKQGVGWFNVENVEEVRYINDITAEEEREYTQIALRLNPEITANTHPYIATGHGGAKFGLTADVIRDLLAHQADYPHIKFAGIHLHIGSQLHDTETTRKAVQAALDLIRPYPDIKTVNIGGGLPVAYSRDETVPAWEDFAAILKPLLEGYSVLLEPGRSIVADAGIFVSQVLYVKKQAGQTFYIIDGSMTELIRPMLYQAHHEIIPVKQSDEAQQPVNVVGPVCETTDVMGREVMLPQMQHEDLIAVMTAGAYGMVMASNYNARPRPPEILVEGEKWSIVHQRETWDELI